MHTRICVLPLVRCRRVSLLKEQDIRITSRLEKEIRDSSCRRTPTNTSHRKLLADVECRLCSRTYTFAKMETILNSGKVAREYVISRPEIQNRGFPPCIHVLTRVFRQISGVDERDHNTRRRITLPPVRLRSVHVDLDFKNGN